VLSGKKLVFAPILRAGMGLLEGMLDLVPSARVAHIGLYRDPESLVAVEYYFKAPTTLGERLVIAVDPMLATGNTAVAAIDRLKEHGASELRFVCLLATEPGVGEAARPPSGSAGLDRVDRQGVERARVHSARAGRCGRPAVRHGEYLCTPTTCNPVWTNLGAIYDPVSDFWTPVAPPAGWTTIGDAQSVVLANGTYMQANCCTTQAALLDPKTLTWTATGAGKFDPNDEEGWTLLPGGDVLAVDAYVPIPPFPYMPDGTNSELYNPRTGSWHSAGSTIVQLWDSAVACGGENVATFELGPAVLRADGTVFYTGSDTCPDGTGNTAIYNSYTGRWHPGPVFPEVDGVTDISIADGPASWEPNDKVLMMASPGFGNTPSVFFEWDGKTLRPVPGTPNAPRRRFLLRQYAAASHGTDSSDGYLRRCRNLHAHHDA
jgi:hypothetical protein